MVRRHRGPERAEPNLTPLLDVVLQLITFFMILIHFGTKLEGATEAIRLPFAPSALPGPELLVDHLPVAIDAEGRLLVEESAYEGAAADRWWAEQARTRREGHNLMGVSERSAVLPTLVIVRADRAVSYGRVREVLRAAQRAGFAHFTLVVLRETR